MFFDKFVVTILVENVSTLVPLYNVGFLENEIKESQRMIEIANDDFAFANADVPGGN